MRILIAGEFVEGALGVSYQRAFEALGHDVACFDVTEELLNVSPLARNRYTRYVGRSAFALRMNQKLLSATVAAGPDLVLVVKGPYVFPGTLRRIRAEVGSTLVNLNPDNPFYPDFTTRHIRATIPLYDCYFTFLRDVVQRLRSAGSPRAEYLPFAYDPQIHRPVEVSGAERRRWGHDLVFIGAWDKERQAWLESLTGFDLGIWGYQWTTRALGSPLMECVCGEGMFGIEMARILCSSKIVLNSLRPQGINGHNMRTFEVLGCGAFELTRRSAGQLEYFDEGQDFECYANTRELREKAAAYLEDESARRHVAALGHGRVRPHTYLSRASRLLDVVDEIGSGTGVPAPTVRLGLALSPARARPTPLAEGGTSLTEVLFLDPPTPGSYQYTLARGLEILGIEVRWVRWSSLQTSRVAKRIQRGLPWLAARKIVETAKDFDGDVLITVKGAHVSPRVLSALRATGKKVVNVYPDSAGRLLHPADRAPLGLWSLITLKDRLAVDTLRSSGLENVRYLPQCFDVDAPYDLPVVDVPEGATFVGHLEPDRAGWVDVLFEAGVKVYGLTSGMRVLRRADAELHRKFRQCHRGGVVSERAKLAFYAGSDVSINIHRPDELFGINKRTFDICGMGGCQVVDWRPGLSDFFVPGKEVVVVETPGELPRRVRELLERWDLRREIADAGRDRAFREHRNDIRAAELLNLIDEIR